VGYKIKITAGDNTLFVTDGTNNTTFSENEANASIFTDTFANIDRYVFSEIKHMPFVSGMIEDYEEGHTYDDIGLQKIEFIYVE
jgi:hypothetical protein